MHPKTFRTSKGWTLEQMATRLGVKHKARVQRQESGRHMPNLDAIDAWKRVSRGKVTFEDFRAAYVERRSATTTKEQDNA